MKTYKLIERIILFLIILLYIFHNSFDKFLIKNIDFPLYEYEESNSTKSLKKLESTINLANTINYNYEISKIKYRNIYKFKEEIEIYKGSNDGIKENLAVIGEKGLIGVTQKVYKNSTIVRLLNNTNSNISVRVNNSYGILKSINGSLLVENITNNDPINIGDNIYTSGLNNIPGEIYIGKVNKIYDNLGIEKKLEIDIASNISDITYVLVVGVK